MTGLMAAAAALAAPVLDLGIGAVHGLDLGQAFTATGDAPGDADRVYVVFVRSSEPPFGLTDRDSQRCDGLEHALQGHIDGDRLARAPRADAPTLESLIATGADLGPATRWRRKRILVPPPWERAPDETVRAKRFSVEVSDREFFRPGANLCAIAVPVSVARTPTASVQRTFSTAMGKLDACTGAEDACATAAQDAILKAIVESGVARGRSGAAPRRRARRLQPPPCLRRSRSARGTAPLRACDRPSPRGRARDRHRSLVAPRRPGVGRKRPHPARGRGMVDLVDAFPSVRRDRAVLAGDRARHPHRDRTGRARGDVESNDRRGSAEGPVAARGRPGLGRRTPRRDRTRSAPGPLRVPALGEGGRRHCAR